MASHPAAIAREAYHKGDYDLSERLIRSLCAREPQQPVWHLDLATLCITLIRYEEAEESLGQAVTHARGNAEIIRQIALCYFSMGRFDEARRLLAPAAAAGNRACELGLLQVLERQGMIQEAAEGLEWSLQRHPADPELRLLRAALLVRQGEAGAAEALVRTLLSSGMPFLLHSKAAYLLAGILDRTERYAEAAEVLRRAKQAARALPGVGRLQKDFRARMALARELASGFRAAQWEAWWSDVAAEPLPFRPALLCGHPRSGTTLLEARIEQIENVVSFDETGAFEGGALSSAGLIGRVNLMRSLKPNGHDLAMKARNHYVRSVTSLHRGPFTDTPLVVDKNPSQLIHLPLWLRLLPEVRILIALRDPRDVVVSSYFFDLPPNPTSVQFLDWESTARHYAIFMDLWRQLKERVPTGCWIECRYEDLVADVAGESARVAEFLSLCVGGKSRAEPSATLQSPNYATATEPVHARSVGRWRHYEEYLHSSGKYLDPFLKDFGYD